MSKTVLVIDEAAVERLLTAMPLLGAAVVLFLVVMAAWANHDKKNTTEEDE